jgi:hypothetical protein
MDHHIPMAVTEGLRLRGVDVLTAYEDGTAQVEDPILLQRANELGRVLFTQDTWPSHASGREAVENLPGSSTVISFN